MKSPIVYFGGKGLLCGRLLPYIPEHKYYAELFGGAMSVLFTKEPCRIEIYNDIFQDVYNFFKVIADKELFEEFKEYLKYPICHEDFLKNATLYLKIAPEKVPDAKRAYYYFYANRIAFSGQGGFGYVKHNKNKSVIAFQNVIEQIDKYHDRLKYVQIFNRNWLEVANIFNEWGRDGFYYLDPPYVLSSRVGGKLYKHELLDEEHNKLVEWLLNECSVNVMLSGYNNTLYDKLLEAGWKKYTFDTYCYIAPVTKHISRELQKRTETIWINFEIKIQTLF